MADVISVVDQKLRRAEKLWTRRSLWEKDWLDLADLGVPNKALELRKAVGGTSIARRLYASAPIKAIKDLAAAMQGTLTNSAIKWAFLKFPIEELNLDPDASFWLEGLTDQMFLLFQQSNLAAELSEAYIDISAFATTAILEDEDDVSKDVFGLRFRTLTIGEYAIAENNKGRPDTLYRRFEMTAQQLVEKFTLEKVSQKVKDEYDKKNFDRRFLVLHAVEARESSVVSTDPTAPGNRRPYGSWYI